MSSKPVMKGSRIETVESASEKYKKLLAKGWKKTSILIAISSDTERHEVAKLCKVLQILAQSSLSLIIPKPGNKKESLGNSLV